MLHHISKSEIKANNFIYQYFRTVQKTIATNQYFSILHSNIPMLLYQLTIIILFQQEEPKHDHNTISTIRAMVLHQHMIAHLETNPGDYLNQSNTLKA